MNGKIWFIAVFLAVVLLGCEPRKVEIQMNPEADSVERSITATNFSDEDLARIAKAYPKPTPKPDTITQPASQAKAAIDILIE